MKRLLLCSATVVVLLISNAARADDADGACWFNLFNGQDLTGWKFNDQKQAKWKVIPGASWSPQYAEAQANLRKLFPDGNPLIDMASKPGMIVANGPRSHLFTEREFKSFEFKAEVMTTPGSNSGIYFHTKYLETGWPTHGHETQVNVTQRDPVKTGSLYGVVKLFKTPAKDNKWWTQHVIVRGRRIIVKIDGQQVIDYTEPDDVKGTRRVSQGSFAFQAHDPKSVVYYRNIRVKPLPD